MISQRGFGFRVSGFGLGFRVLSLKIQDLAFRIDQLEDDVEEPADRSHDCDREGFQC